MNERIIKLGLESGMLNYVDNETPRHYFLCGNADEECLVKFALLIVKECIAIVEPSSYRRAYPENYRGGIDCLELLEERAAKIKEHFGVKGE
jgi:hypothetical protein